MQPQNHEEETLSLFIPHIEQYCDGRWMNMELEDRILEASYVFVQALRNFAWISGHFWQDYLSRLCPYMDALNKQTPSPRYPRTLSMDKEYAVPGSSKGTSLHGIVKGSDINHQLMELSFFLESLPPADRRIVSSLADGTPKHHVAAEHGYTIRQLNNHLANLAERYHDADWEDFRP